MTLIDDVKSRTDIVLYISRYLPLRKRGRDYEACCPFHQEKSPSFKVNAGRQIYKCFGCGAGGDVITFAVEYHKMTPGAAITMLAQEAGIQPDGKPRPPQKPVLKLPSRPEQAPADMRQYSSESAAWQAAADDFVTSTSNRLWSPQGTPAMAYLRGRGLTPNVIMTAELGYQDVPYNAMWGDSSVFVPPSITIPWHMSQHTYWRIRYRVRPALQERYGRYKQATGSANGLYTAGQPGLVKQGSIAVLTEGEINALSVQVACGRDVAALATGGTQNAHIMRFVVQLGLCDLVLLAFDNDENGAGDQAAKWWIDTLGVRKARRLRPRGAKDVNDMLTMFGPAVVRQWVESATCR